MVVGEIIRIDTETQVYPPPHNFADQFYKPLSFRLLVASGERLMDVLRMRSHNSRFSVPGGLCWIAEPGVRRDFDLRKCSLLFKAWLGRQSFRRHYSV